MYNFSACHVIFYKLYINHICFLWHNFNDFNDFMAKWKTMWVGQRIKGRKEVGWKVIDLELNHFNGDSSPLLQKKHFSKWS